MIIIIFFTYVLFCHYSISDKFNKIFYMKDFARIAVQRSSTLWYVEREFLIDRLMTII